MNFIPVGDNILVMAAERPDQTKSGLYLPTTTQDGQVLEGVVIAIGDGRILDDGRTLQISKKIVKGSLVWFPKFNSTKVTLDSRDYFVVSERSLLGIANDPDKPF